MQYFGHVYMRGKTLLTSIVYFQVGAKKLILLCVTYESLLQWRSKPTKHPRAPLNPQLRGGADPKGALLEKEKERNIERLFKN